MSVTAPFDLSELTARVARDGAVSALRTTRPPPVVDGLSIGIARMSQPPPHAGERHLDGDELLYLIAGRALVVLETEAGEERIELVPGRAIIVPRGLWHRVVPQGEVALLYATPGPHNERRPLPSS